MPESESPELSPFEEEFKELSKKFFTLSHKSAITFGEEGDSVRREKDAAFRRLATLAAGKVAESHPAERRSVLHGIVDSLREATITKAPGYSVAPIVHHEFVEETLLKAVDLAEQGKKG